jgi:hypothetical protein
LRVDGPEPISLLICPGQQPLVRLTTGALSEAELAAATQWLRSHRSQIERAVAAALKQATVSSAPGLIGAHQTKGPV